MSKKNQDGGRKILGTNQQNSPKNMVISTAEEVILGATADLDPKSFFHRLDFECTLFKTCLGTFYPKNPEIFKNMLFIEYNFIPKRSDLDL
jgi:hypothetical protein